jgi:hypothetical protein
VIEIRPLAAIRTECHVLVFAALFFDEDTEPHAIVVGADSFMEVICSIAEASPHLYEQAKEQHKLDMARWN